MQQQWISELLTFWFDELAPAQWFEKSVTVDQRIKESFSAVYEEVSSRDAAAEVWGGADEGTDVAGTADRVLAHVILLDQLPRNMFRGTARMFASDTAALAIARAAVERGLDAGMSTSQRLFIYLPFEHSESLVDQDLSVRLFKELGHAEYLRYAEAHREVILRFGRFPHRNALLGRVSTVEEIAFLKQPGSSF